MDYRALKQELANAAYQDKTNADAAAALNAPGVESIERGLVSPAVLLGDLFDVVIALRQTPDTTPVPAGLPVTMTIAVLKQLLADIRFVDPINVNLDANQQFMQVLAAYGLMGTADQAAAKILDVSTIAVSRAEKLLGRGVVISEDDVHNAKVGEW